MGSTPAVTPRPNPALQHEPRLRQPSRRRFRLAWCSARRQRLRHCFARDPAGARRRPLARAERRPPRPGLQRCTRAVCFLPSPVKQGVHDEDDPAPHPSRATRSSAEPSARRRCPPPAPAHARQQSAPRTAARNRPSAPPRPERHRKTSRHRGGPCRHGDHHVCDCLVAAVVPAPTLAAPGARLPLLRHGGSAAAGCERRPGAPAARLATHPARRSSAALPCIEFHAEAGAPEGALYVDGAWSAACPASGGCDVTGVRAPEAVHVARVLRAVVLKRDEQAPITGNATLP